MALSRSATSRFLPPAPRRQVHWHSRPTIEFILGPFDLYSDASLNAVATITANGVVGVSSTASLSATGTITSAGAATGTASLAATGTITADGTVAAGAYSGTASLAATDTIAATGVLGLQTGATLSATDTITAAGRVDVYGTAALSATDTVSAAGIVGLSSTATLSATGTITSSGTVDTPAKSGTAALAATGTVQAAGTVTGASSPTSHGGKLYADHMGPGRGTPVIRRRSSARGLTLTSGRASGVRTMMGRTCGQVASEHRTVRVLAHRTTHCTGVLRQPVIEHRCTVTAPRDHEYLALYAELRRVRDDHELTLLL